MIRIFITIVLFVFSQKTFSQQLHHEMLSSQGGSSVTSSGHIIRYTVGQQSVIGTSTNGYVIQQGFQQSNWDKIMVNNTISISTTVYPNPFVETVNFTFSSSPGTQIDVVVFDILGRLVHSEVLMNENNTVSIDLKKLSSAEYLVRLSSGGFFHAVKIIKK